MNEVRKLVTKKDLIILTVLLIIAAAVFAFRHFGLRTANTAVISVDGREYMRISLADGDSREITLENGVKIIVSDGRIGFADSDCPDRICVDTGMLSRAGDAAACVPNRTLITVVGSDAAVDTVTY